MNAKTPIVSRIKCGDGEIAVHAATLAHVLALSKSGGQGDIAPAIEIIDDCVEMPDGIEGRPSELLPATIASKALQAATAEDASADFTGR